jgi:hypothetical protein
MTCTAFKTVAISATLLGAALGSVRAVDKAIKASPARSAGGLREEQL